jgi:DNA topoisomerase-1
LSRDTITLQQALDLLAFPKELGEMDGEKVVLLLGRFGPYFKVGVKNVGLPAGVDPLSVDLNRARELIGQVQAEKKAAMAALRVLGVDPVSGGSVEVKSGRFGPYVTDGKTNASLSKKIDPETITLEEAADLLVKKRARGPSRWRGMRKKRA